MGSREGGERGRKGRRRERGKREKERERERVFIKTSGVFTYTLMVCSLTSGTVSLKPLAT